MRPAFPRNCRAVWFDMDHTLINNDCDVSWKKYVVAAGQADPAVTARMAEDFYQDYLFGKLNVRSFLAFQLREFAGRTEAEMAAEAEKHYRQYALPNLFPMALAWVREAQRRRLPTAILTSTNAVLAEPLRRELGIDRLFAPELERDAEGRYTGRAVGIYPDGAGKLAILRKVCSEECLDPETVAYFGDSVNDLPVLRTVGFPFAVNPGTTLRSEAESRGWPILHFELER